MSAEPTRLPRRAPSMRVPRGLTPEGRRLWTAVAREYELDAASEKLLLVALEALERLREAQRTVKEHGLLVAGARGGLRANPAISIENAARRDFLAAMRQLDFDTDPVTLSPHARAAENAPYWRNG